VSLGTKHARRSRYQKKKRAVLLAGRARAAHFARTRHALFLSSHSLLLPRVLHRRRLTLPLPGFVASSLRHLLSFFFKKILLVVAQVLSIYCCLQRTFHLFRQWTSEATTEVHWIRRQGGVSNFLHRSVSVCMRLLELRLKKTEIQNFFLPPTCSEVRSIADFLSTVLVLGPHSPRNTLCATGNPSLILHSTARKHGSTSRSKVFGSSV
jgi:hypothetical protein